MSGSAVGRQLALGAHPLPGRPAADVDGVGAVVGRGGALGLLEGPVGEQRVDLVDGPGQLLTRRQSHSRVLSLVGPAILSSLPQPVGDLAEGARRAAQHVEHPVAAAACAGRGRGRGRPAAPGGRRPAARSASASAAPVTPQADARPCRPSPRARPRGPAPRARGPAPRGRRGRSRGPGAPGPPGRARRSSRTSRRRAPRRRGAVAADVRPGPAVAHRPVCRAHAGRVVVEPLAPPSRTVRAHADSEAGSPGHDAHDRSLQRCRRRHPCGRPSASGTVRAVPPAGTAYRPIAGGEVGRALTERAQGVGDLVEPVVEHALGPRLTGDDEAGQHVVLGRGHGGAQAVEPREHRAGARRVGTQGHPATVGRPAPVRRAVIHRPPRAAGRLRGPRRPAGPRSRGGRSTAAPRVAGAAPA